MEANLLKTYRSTTTFVKHVQIDKFLEKLHKKTNLFRNFFSELTRWEKLSPENA
jgi:hypothetical protein